MRIVKQVIVVSLVAVVAGLCVAGCGAARRETTEGPSESPRPADKQVWLFDMGAGGSPLMDGHIRVASDSLYSEKSKFGWMEAGHRNFTTETPTRREHWYLPRDLVYEMAVNPLNRDGAEDEQTMNFRLDVHPGRYHVVATVGNLTEPLHSLSIYANGNLVARNLSAQIPRDRGFNVEGFFLRVRFDVEVNEPYLLLSFAGDQSDYDKWLEEEKAKPSPISWLVPGRSLKPHAPYRDIGGPFTRNSVLGVEVYPYLQRPFSMKDSDLEFDVPGIPEGMPRDEAARLAKVVNKFNEGSFAEAEALLDGVRAPELSYAKALGYAWLAGHPQYEKDFELSSKVAEALDEYAAVRPDDYRATELRELNRCFAEGAELIERRSISTAEQRGSPRVGPATWDNSYFRIYRGQGWLSQLRPGDPFYYKALIYRARGFFIVDPHRWVKSAGTGYDMLREVERKFPRNRFVRLYLHEDWEPSGEWAFPAHIVPSREAPAWAAALWEGYNRMLDLCEWWFTHKQFRDGSLGGGWGDDVEALRLFGSYGAISPDASEVILAGCRLLSNGAWFSGDIDTESGFFRDVGDTEHSGEFTGDTLPVMMVLDYGSPVWIERAMMTGKLMRDLWMDRNESGYFMMRSNLLGATGVGGGLAANESRINYRPALPARKVLEYNGNPTLEAIFGMWADSWLGACMATSKGKPGGVMPQEFAFQDMEIGGKEAPSWHQANHSKGTVNYDWEGLGGYHDYILDLLMNAHQRTGDPKYLEPFRLEAELAAAYKENPVADPQPGSAAWAGKALLGRPEAPAHSAISIWEGIQRVLNPQAAGETITTLDEVKAVAEELNRESRKRWPIVTTESVATDRIYVPGMVGPFRAYTAAGSGGQLDMHVTYSGFGRDFAAVVLVSDPRRLKIIMYNMAPEAREGGVRPWVLEPGALYGVLMGPDMDSNTQIDEAIVTTRATAIPSRVETEWSLSHRGTPLPLVLPSRVPWVVEVTQLRRGQPQGLLPDLAISGDDIRHSQEGGDAIVTVHNVGSAEARKVKLVVYGADPAGGAPVVAEHVIPHVAAPIYLDPQTVSVGFQLRVEDIKQKIVVLVDPDDEIQEITKVNNRAEKQLGRQER